jgi:quercetin dioxygenase-like cupin family protein
MRVARGRDGRASEHRTETFTGRVWADPVLPAVDGVGVATVIFEPGARTHWHRHEIGQVLYVTHGEGRLQSADGTGHELRPGDVAHIPAGEVHWHGAAPGSLLVHVAVSLGTNEWLEPVSDADYDQAFN